MSGAILSGKGVLSVGKISSISSEIRPSTSLNSNVKFQFMLQDVLKKKIVISE